VLKNQAEILDGKLTNARVLEKEAFVVENESGRERIRKGQKRQKGERSGREQAAPYIILNLAGLNPRRWDALPFGFYSTFQVGRTSAPSGSQRVTSTCKARVRSAYFTCVATGEAGYPSDLRINPSPKRTMLSIANRNNRNRSAATLLT
jgi:hypothetical protein